MSANSSGGLESSSTSGGSLILPTNYSPWASQSDPTEYEVSMTLALKSNTGSGVGFVQYVHASETALSNPGGSADAGTYDAMHLFSPTFDSDGYCSATLEFYERTSSGTTLRASTPVPCANGMVMRTVAWSNVVSTMINGQVYSFTSNLTGGAPGVGLYGASSPTGITAVQVGPRCMTVPNAIVASTVGSSAFPTNVSLHWQEPSQPQDVTTVGIAQLYVTRNPGSWNYIDQGTYYTDPTTSAATSYTYAMQEVSFHGVASAATNISVTTPPALDIDPRRTGVKPLGTYWGAEGENIDMLSGNLNFTMPLLTAQGRGGWTVPVSLSYNSQAWRKDPGGVWQLSQDVGYGFGWQLMAGSLTPYWDQNALTIDHFVYTDSTGAQYRLYHSPQARTSGHPNCNPPRPRAELRSPAKASSSTTTTTRRFCTSRTEASG